LIKNKIEKKNLTENQHLVFLSALLRHNGQKVRKNNVALAVRINAINHFFEVFVAGCLSKLLSNLSLIKQNKKSYPSEYF
jgi:hypothetical protein